MKTLQKPHWQFHISIEILTPLGYLTRRNCYLFLESSRKTFSLAIGEQPNFSVFRKSLSFSSLVNDVIWEIGEVSGNSGLGFCWMLEILFIGAFDRNFI